MLLKHLVDLQLVETVRESVGSGLLGIRTDVVLKHVARQYSYPNLHDDHLPLLLGEFRKLYISVASLSKICRPGSGQISVGGSTYYWSGCSGGCNPQGVAVAEVDQLLLMVSSVTPFNCDRLGWLL